MQQDIFFDLDICKRGRQCVGGCVIHKGEPYFVYKRWVEGQQYPTTKNICMQCAEGITEPEFMTFLQKLLNGLKKLETKRKEVVPA